jgi:hypothetical protein
MFPEEQTINFLDRDPLMAFTATSDPDIMYLHETMRQPDRKQFLETTPEKATSGRPNSTLTVPSKPTSRHPI